MYRGFDSKQGREISPLQRVQTGYNAHPPSIQWKLKTQIRGGKTPSYEDHHSSSPSDSEFENAFMAQEKRNLQDHNLNKKIFQRHPATFGAQELCSHLAGLYLTRNRTADLYETCCVTID